MYRAGIFTLVAALALGVATPAAAVNVAFASFIPTGTGSNVRYQKLGVASGLFYTISTPNATSPGAVAVKFSFLDPVLSTLGVLDASFYNFATTNDNPSLSAGGLLIQTIDSGTKTFTYTGTAPLVVGTTTYTTGANLLTMNFTNGTIFGINGSSAGSAIASTPLGIVNFTSDFLTFDPAGNRDGALALSAISPSLNRVNPDSSIASFRGVAGGVFSAEFTPTTLPVPEPSVWAMLIAGYGMVGATVRRRRRNIVTAYTKAL